MLFSTIFAATALVGAAIAEDHIVTVSNKAGDFKFIPDSLQAEQGDTVTFRFWPKNHSVAQSTFAAPCTPMPNGFWSGFVPTVSTEVVANRTFTMEVTNASTPLWFYCSQARHCQNGMVGVINPPRTGERTLAAYKNASQSAQANLSPSSATPIGGNITNGTATSDSPSASGSSPATATGAASHFAGSAAFAGLTSFFAYLLI